MFYLVLVVGALVFLGVDARHDLGRLQSLIGVVVLLLFGFIFSVAPKKVSITNFSKHTVNNVNFFSSEL